MVTTGTTGFPNNLKNSEVIDLLDSKNYCQDLSDYTYEVNWATGGLLNNINPLICGGRNSFNIDILECNIIGTNEKLELMHPRTFSASIVIGDKLWVTGGEISPNTSEFILLNEKISMAGPDLPTDFNSHCLTWANDTHVILTGGKNTDVKTFVVDIHNNFSMVPGPLMHTPRQS